MSSVAQSRGPATRLVFVDYLRAGAIIYIVGFWHLWEYAPNAPAYQNSVTHTATLIALGLFVFLSGFLLGRSPVPRRGKDFLDFYRKRLLRVYPLYLAGLIVFVAVGLSDMASAVKAAVGVSMFFGPSPPTVWFVAMLLWFYLLAPLLLASAPRVPLFIGICAVLYVAMGVVAWILPQADKRLFAYFPAFAAGLAAGSQLWSPGRWLFFSTVCAVGFPLLMCLVGDLGLMVVPLDGVVVLAGSACLFGMCARNAQAFSVNRLLAFVSYASFAMYLFHRPILAACTGAFMPDGFPLQWLYLTIVCLPLIGLVSWIVQRVYDQMMINLRNS
jgi:peptidoglycan/LPS O-acetylase OafA/YrhL